MSVTTAGIITRLVDGAKFLCNLWPEWGRLYPPLPCPGTADKFPHHRSNSLARYWFAAFHSRALTFIHPLGGPDPSNFSSCQGSRDEGNARHVHRITRRRLTTQSNRANHR